MISCLVVPPVGGWYSVLKVRVRWPKDEKTTAFNLLNNFLPISFNQYSLTVSQINYPGASTQALCSAPTSPLTALAFLSCSRKIESGV